MVFVTQGGRVEERPVVVGKQNDKWVQILEGLAEDEEVLMTPPPGYMPQKQETEDSKMRGPGTAVPGGAPRAAAGAGIPPARHPAASRARAARLRPNVEREAGTELYRARRAARAAGAATDSGRPERAAHAGDGAGSATPGLR